MIIPRKSRVLEKMRSGKKALCFKSNLSCPRVADIVGLTGFDALWICQEHVPTDNSTMEHMIAVGKAHDMDTIVRVAKGCYSDYIRPLCANRSDLVYFINLFESGDPLLASSSMRFCKELIPYYNGAVRELGELRMIQYGMPKK